MAYNPLELGKPLDETAQSSSIPNQTTNSAEAETSTPTHTKSEHQDGSVPPKLTHTRTAPTTIPIAPVAHQIDGISGSNGQTHDSPTDSEGSPTPTLHTDVPAIAGGLHGQPMPGSKAANGDLNEKDHQAVGTGGKTGSEIATLAKKELGIDTTSHDNDTFDEKAAYKGPPSPSATKKPHRIERTASGTTVSRSQHATGDVVQGLGMVPITRKTSQPPGVGIFGGVAPSGIDAEEGLAPVRSHEEEEEREILRKAKGPDPFAVKFEDGEKTNPKNWSVGYRWYLTGVAGLLVLNSTFASSSPSGIVRDMIAYFGFSQEVAVLTISLFVAGYCIGPLLWGPLSEVYGRRPLFIGCFVVYTGFQVGCALSKNTASILIFRFLGGCFAAAPLTNSGAMLADIWDVDHRGQAMSIFSLAPFAGPSIGPIVAGYISVTGTDWRWVFWILTIFAGVCLAIIVVGVPETYTPILLVKKAKKMRKETGDERYYAPLEKASTSFKHRINTILFKPFIMLALEPMLMAVTLYMSFVYGVVYLLFEAYPFVFEQNHGFNSGENGLAFLGFFSGGALAVVFFMTIIEPRYLRHVKRVAPEMPKPEKRLELCIVSGWCLVIAMFWFGWTSYSSIHWISPVLAGGLIGVGVLGMFVSCFNYIIDVYLWAAASALAGTTVVRSLFGAAFPLFATQMYDKLGTQWASSLLGFIALLLAPIPILLTIYGPALRKKSKYSPNKNS